MFKTVTIRLLFIEEEIKKNGRKVITKRILYWSKDNPQFHVLQNRLRLSKSTKISANN